MSTRTAYTWGERAGIALVVISCVLFALLVVVPFLPVAGESKLAIGASLAIVGEGTFWIGCLVAGRRFVLDLCKKLCPAHWRRNARS